MDFLTDASSLFLSEKEIVNLVLLVSAGASVVFASGYKLYTKIRPRFPIKANCWFCNKYSDVKFSRRNSWDCPFCEQYNGFLPDGDYNKIIPAQSDELLNHSTVTAKRGPYISSDNGLCRKCNINQELKIQQLASFTPIDSARYDEEIELYRQRLERAYQLCPECDCKTQLLLSRIGRWVTEKYGTIEKKITFHNNKVLFLKNLLHSWMNRISKFCDILLLPANFGLLVCLFARIMPLVPVQVSSGTRRILVSCTLWEESLMLVAGTVHLVCALSGLFNFAVELIPVILWTVFIVMNHASTNLTNAFNMQHFAYAQIAVMAVAQGTSLWSRIHPRKSRCTKKKHLKHRSKKAENTVDPLIENTEEILLDSKINNADSLPDMPPVVNQTFDYQADPLELQSGLDSLTLGPMNPKPSTPSIFEHRVYQPRNYMFSDFESNSPFVGNFPGPLRKRKSVLTPPKLQFTHSSWVTGGCWQQNHVFPSSTMPVKSMYSNPSMYPFPSAPISRSSSQSSGFVSNVGTNFSSVPNSRAGSVCDGDRCSVLSEPIHPSYSHPLYWYLATSPPPGATLVFPTHPSPSPTPTLTREHISPYSSHVSTRSVLDASSLEASQKSLVSVVKENLLLATLFFSSLTFNIIVIALAAVNTFREH